ncbi:MAG: membrane dipeptidase [Bacteroidetes bacterium]|nr:membrane dipeptidase [Bacteroidota bacterium]MBI3483217.1 membrane dipeptidase [Bacteroidota bacterium]
MKALSTVLLSAIFFVSCSDKRPVDRMNDEQLRAYADSLAHKFIITDGHVDLPYRLKETNFTKDSINVIISTKKGDFDFERAMKGGLDAPFMSIYIPSKYQQHDDYGKALADSLIDMVTLITQQLPEKFALAKTPSDVEANTKAGKISFPMGMENGAPIGKDLSNVKYFYDRGIRYVTITHGKDNQFCDSSYDTLHTWHGLSSLGKDLVKEMNRVGIMIDISHVDDSTFYQVMKLSKAPCIASHSSCRAFTPKFYRNMTDDMIKLLGKNDGVIQINFGSTFLDSIVRQKNDINTKKLQSILKEKNLKASDSMAKPIVEQFKKDNLFVYADVATVADHIDHVVKLAGIDHVGIGSDFDGVGDSLPTGLKDVSAYPNLIYTLLKRGYTESDIEKICYKNVWRVWNKVEQVAKESK